jgi:hypothetical protein
MNASTDSPTISGYGSDAILRPQGFETPDNESAVWPVPHCAKIDCIEILRVALGRLGMHDIPISKDGAFTAAQMKNEAGASVPYITVTRLSDLGVRRGLSNLIGAYAEGDPLLLDPTGIVQPGGAAAIYGEYSNTTIDITISDKNPHRADLMYIIIKILMQAARKEFTRIGYIDVRRVNGNDSAIPPNEGTPYIIFSRTLSYLFDYPDYIANVDTAIHLVKQTLVLDEHSPDASISTDL